MFFPVVGTDMCPQVGSRFLLLLTIGTLKFYIRQVERLNMVGDDMFQMVNFSTECALPQCSPVFRGQLFHVLKDRSLKKIWGEHMPELPDDNLQPVTAMGCQG